MNKELVIATKNPGKFRQIADALDSLKLDLKSLVDFPEVSGIKIVEDGKSEEENARMKVVPYGEVLKKNVLGMDNGLYFEGLPDELQPRQEVRRFWGDRFNRRPTDEELLAHFSGVIRGLGGEVEGNWRFAVCLRDVNGRLFETALIEPRVFVWQPAEKIEPGYPLGSLQKDPATGKYISELPSDDKAHLWRRLIGGRLCNFVNESLDMKGKENGK